MMMGAYDASANDLGSMRIWVCAGSPIPGSVVEKAGAMLSGGRVLFGIGGGWNAEEMANHGTAWKSRWRLLRERVLAMKAIWTQKEASFHGELVRFDRIWSEPKPLQKPHPPVIIGGDGGADGLQGEGEVELVHVSASCARACRGRRRGPAAG